MYIERGDSDEFISLAKKQDVLYFIYERKEYMRKKITKIILSFILSTSLLLPSTTVSAAAPTSDVAPIQPKIHIMELDNNNIFKMSEDSSKRITAYYQNNILKQVAVLQKGTGDIYYYDIGHYSTFAESHSFSEDILPKSYTAKYNVQDFIQNSWASKKYSSNNIYAYNNQDFIYLKSKIYDDLGQTYRRYLYGYTDSKQYKQNSWHFEAGTALSVVMAVIGFMEVIDPRISALATAAGILLSALTTQEWIKELFWVYKFKQTSPTDIEFVCSLQFTYEKQRRVEVNGDEGYWETFDKESDISIEITRDNILTSPGLYW